MRMGVVAALVTGVVVVAGAQPASAESKTLTVQVSEMGEFDSRDPENSFQTSAVDNPGAALAYCQTMGSRVRGQQVKVVDESGKTVGLGQLGKISVASQPNNGVTVGMWVCTFTAKFKIKAADFYNVSIGGSDAGDFSSSDLKRKKWRLFFSMS